LEHGRVVVAEESPDAEEGLGPRSLQDIGRLRALEAGVQGDEDGPDTEQTERSEDPLGHVRGPDGHPVTGSDARRHGRPADPQRLAFEPGERQTELPVDQSLGVTEAFGGRGHEARDRFVEEVGPGDPPPSPAPMSPPPMSPPPMSQRRRSWCWLETETTSPDI